MVTVIYSDEFLQHQTGMLHPERSERLTAIVSALKSVSWASQVHWQSPTPVPEREAQLMGLLQQVHSLTYIKEVEFLAKRGGGYLDGDTPVAPQSYQVALLAVSAWLDGVDQVVEQGEPSFVLARPPGHHAESQRGMGFCLFSNAALAAHYALGKPGINKVAILDWDVHHGNGTQTLVETHPCMAYCSLHQSPCYPGTGYADEIGYHNNVLNIPMAPGSTYLEYQQEFQLKVVPFLSKFGPDLLIVSAGYDANAADPLANIELLPQDFGRLTDYCLQLTRHIVFGLEGGYALPELASSVVATLERCILPSGVSEQN